MSVRWIPGRGGLRPEPGCCTVARWNGYLPSCGPVGQFDTRFAAFVGPLEGTRDALLILRASSASEIVERLASDPWTANGLLITKQISPWQLRLGSLIP